MNVLLTDRLACPRCGPGFGLILLADRVRDRRVLVGTWGCPNCRDRFPVEDGFGDLRPPPRRPLPPVTNPPVEPPADESLRIAALLGVREGPATLVLLGSAALHANALADRVARAEVLAVEPRLRWWSEVGGVSRIAAGARLPLQNGASRGLVLGPGAEVDLPEAARVVGPRSRLVVLDPADGLEDTLAREGLRLLARDDRAAVAQRG